MTRFAERTFTVGGHRPPQSECRHGWLDARGHCVFCGAAAALVHRDDTGRHMDAIADRTMSMMLAHVMDAERRDD